MNVYYIVHIYLLYSSKILTKPMSLYSKGLAIFNNPIYKLAALIASNI